MLQGGNIAEGEVTFQYMAMLMKYYWVFSACDQTELTFKSLKMDAIAFLVTPEIYKFLCLFLSGVPENSEDHCPAAVLLAKIIDGYRDVLSVLGATSLKDRHDDLVKKMLILFRRFQCDIVSHREAQFKEVLDVAANGMNDVNAAEFLHLASGDPFDLEQMKEFCARTKFLEQEGMGNILATSYYEMDGLYDDWLDAARAYKVQIPSETPKVWLELEHFVFLGSCTQKLIHPLKATEPRDKYVQSLFQDSTFTPKHAQNLGSGMYRLIQAYCPKILEPRDGGGGSKGRATRDGRCGKEKKRDDEKIMCLQLQRRHFEAIKSGRKRWKGRPLVERRKDASFAPWRYCHLATEGRVVKFQSGPPPNLVMRVAEVRLFAPNERSSIPPEQAMVMELGTDLLPDEADANARVRVYREIYGAEICAHGFVAMRLTRADEIKAADESSTRVLEEPRTMVVASNCADAANVSQPA